MSQLEMLKAKELELRAQIHSAASALRYDADAIAIALKEGQRIHSLESVAGHLTGLAEKAAQYNLVRELRRKLEADQPATSAPAVESADKLF